MYYALGIISFSFFYLLDPADYDLPVLKQALHFYQDPAQAPEVLHKLNKTILEADAYTILTAEYNRSLPPALTNLMDHFPTARLVVLSD